MQTRREFLRNTPLAVTSLSAMSILSAGCTENLSSRPSKGPTPNIIFIQSDQLNTKALSCYGGQVNTPNIDRFAKKGAKSANAACVVLFCSPSRVNCAAQMEGI